MSKKSRRAQRKQREQQMKILVPVLAVAAVLVVLLVIFGAMGSGSTAGSAASSSAGVSTSTVQLISPANYRSQFVSSNTTHLLLDVRTPEEFNSGHIAGAVNINVEELAGRLNEVPQDRPIVLYCRTGNRSAQAGQILATAGYTGIYDLGGIVTWVEQGFPVQ